MWKKDDLIHMFQRVFEELDADESGSITLQEFEDHIDDERIEAFLEHLGLTVSQVKLLFFLIDVDGSGQVSLEEFVAGCLKLKGGAKMFDMAVLKYQMEWVLHNIMSVSSHLGIAHKDGDIPQ